MNGESGRTLVTSGTVTREQIGDRIAAARRLLRWDQADLARAMYQRTGDPDWNNKKISKIERGKKIVPAEELHVFAAVQGQDITWYYDSPYNGAPSSTGRNPR